MKVMIAGIAGASLGTEIAKALRLAGGYEIIGADISPLAYGHFDSAFCHTLVLERDGYIDNLLEACQSEGIDALIAGAEQTTELIGKTADRFRTAGILVVLNNPDVVALCTDKAACFDELSRQGITIPQTRRIETPADLEGFPVPCVIKPSRDSGGSAYVFFARTREEAALYVAYLVNNRRIALAQEYISHQRGEFTVGVLSLPDGTVAGSVALRRSFTNKLSVAAQGDGFLISSGYSQGEIADFPEIRATAERIARLIGSTGPINVQGRVSASGDFMPFEINPRFSATTYLRAMAGFQEIDYLIRHMAGLPPRGELAAKPGWYLRTLTETYTPAPKDAP